MALSTKVILIRNLAESVIIKWCKDNNYRGYVMPINPLWSAVILDFDLTILQGIALKFSETYHIVTMCIFEYEDYGWNFFIAFDGEPKFQFDLNYEFHNDIVIIENKIRKIEENIHSMKHRILDEGVISRLDKFVESFRADPGLIYDGLNLLVDSFEIYNVKEISYNYLSQLPSNDLIDIKVSCINVDKETKSVNFKKIVKRIFEKKINELGYFSPKLECGNLDVSFLKEINGFKRMAGLTILKSRYGNTIRADLQVPEVGIYELFEVTEGRRTDFYYENEDELKLVLNKILEQFFHKGQKYLEIGHIEVFDPTGLYEDIVDSFFKHYGYKRIFMTDNFTVGGKVIYSNGECNVHFKHGANNACVKCYIQEKARCIEIYELSNQQEFITSLKDALCRNREEFQITIHQILGALKELYFGK